jgi:putative transposase
VSAHDLVFDACATGQQIKCLTVYDEFTRECLAIDVAGSIRPNRVIELLSRLISARGAPRHMRSDNGPEFVSHAILTRIRESNIETALNDPGKPWRNGTDESFDRRLRDECLNQECFRSRQEAQVANGHWRRRYNEVRPHSSLQYMTALEFHRQHATSTNPEAALK